MSKTFGMPGPGGSLGQCAICGKPFLAEVLLGETVKEFNVNGTDQGLFGHKKCLKEIANIKTFDELPDGPLRDAYMRQKS